MTIAGFYYIDPSTRRQRYLPQARVEAHASILSTISRTTLTQTFMGSSDQIPELRYSFPLYDGVSVVGFTCTIGKRVIKGVVKEKHKARQVYKEAVGHGLTAGLLEQLPESSDVFTTTIGNVPGGAEIQVEVVYLGELKHDAQIDGIRLTIPTSIAPRYGSYPGELATHAPTSGSMKVVVDAEVPTGSHITSIQSPSHHLAVTLGQLSTTTGAEPSFQRASATLSLSTAELDKDFVLQVRATNTGNPSAILEEHPTIPNQRALMATLVPKFQLPPEKPEIIFVCDRSGSMAGTKMENLKTALRLLVKSLRVGMKFNICSFGNHHSFLWKRSHTYDEFSMNKAMKHIETFDANFGGTEMYQPIEDSFKRRYTDMNLEVFLLTDGEIWDQGRLVGLINEHVSTSNGAIRLFSLGIGRAASHALMEGVAQAGNGFSQSVTDNEEMGSKVVRMLKGATFPHIKQYTLEVKYASEPRDDIGDEFEVVEGVSDGPVTASSTPSSTSALPAEPPKPIISLFQASIDQDVEMKDAGDEERYSGLPNVSPPKFLQAPFEIPTLFPFNRTSVYLLMSPSNNLSPRSVVLKGDSIHGALELEIPITVLEQKGETIHQLAAKKAVGELERGKGWIYHAKSVEEPTKLLKEKHDGHFQDMVEREAVRLGVQYQIGGKWCSFVAVEATGEVNQQSSDNDHKSQAHPGLMQQRSGQMGSLTSGHVGQNSLPQVIASGKFYSSPRRPTSNEQNNSSLTSNIALSNMAQPHVAQAVPITQAAALAPPTAQIDHKLLEQYRKEMEEAAAMPLVDEDDDLLDFSDTNQQKAQPPQPPRKSAMPASIRSKKFDGFWTWDQKLRGLMGWNEATIQSVNDKIHTSGELGLNASATACVIAWLRKEKMDEKDAWELLVDKAVAWLEDEFGGADELVELARSTV
ncbi:von Willebrand factor type A domain-containing protein [Truncatella angustata]|uniref:von Willebrand factor type A domain-containing protein n=1 Tax=Truncatella angustata TaxID=152316 RepID=A0A9P8UEZ8_9PEZI|nr:von Willebrand factor type A domain-containing protein [Truncatella angustata]KAH6648655.1 von Willebrand factor type A domain-containing protein [Truncatella angustata]